MLGLTEVQKEGLNEGLMEGPKKRLQGKLNERLKDVSLKQKSDEIT